MSSLTIRLMSAKGKGFSNAAFTMLNSPVAAAIPTARETTAVAATPGLRRKMRSAYRRSTARMSSKKFPQRRVRKRRLPLLNLGERQSVRHRRRQPCVAPGVGAHLAHILDLLERAIFLARAAMAGPGKCALSATPHDEPVAHAGSPLPISWSWKFWRLLKRC